MGFINYLRDVKGELRHVSWPTKTQAVQYTILVLGLSILTGIFLGLLDFGFGKLLQRFLETL